MLVYVGRSLATSCWCSLGCARSEAGLASLRPSERSETLRVGASRTGVHRSGLVQRSGTVCKAGESGQGAGGTVPTLGAWPRTSASVGSVKPGLLFCAAIAALQISFLPRSGHLFMPDPRALKTLENLDGWIAPKTSDEDGSSNVRARVAQAPPGMT